MILECELEAGFDRFRTAGYEHHILEVAAAIPGDDGGQLFQCVAGEIVAVALGDPPKLVGNRGIHFLIAVADAIDGGAA